METRTFRVQKSRKITNLNYWQIKQKIFFKIWVRLAFKKITEPITSGILQFVRIKSTFRESAFYIYRQKSCTLTIRPQFSIKHKYLSNGLHGVISQNSSRKVHQISQISTLFNARQHIFTSNIPRYKGFTLKLQKYEMYINFI